jgi:hypothetical protein
MERHSLCPQAILQLASADRFALTDATSKLGDPLWGIVGPSTSTMMISGIRASMLVLLLALANLSSFHAGKVTIPDT